MATLGRQCPCYPGSSLPPAILAWREARGIYSGRQLQMRIDGRRAAGRAALGKRAFDAAWAAGRAVEFRQAIAEAIAAAREEH